MTKNVALAVVVNPKGATVIDGARGASGVSVEMVRDFIDKDVKRYPELRANVAAIEDIVILSDEEISSDNYAQEMMQCYVKHMGVDDWASPGGLHIFETFLASVVVHIAYGI